MAKETTEKQVSIEDLVSELNKELKLESIHSMGSSKATPMSRLSSGSLTYDICTGGGYPIGRHTTLFGAESSGKTTNVLMALAKYQKTGDKRYAFINDAEFAMDKNYAIKLGVDLKKVIILQPDHLAEAHDVLMGLLKKDAIGFFVTDSIAALLPKSVIENEADASNIGKHAQAIGNMFKISNSYVGKQKVVALWINQIRDSIGGYGGGVTTPAGHAPKFYSSIMIQVFRGSKEDNGDGTFSNKGKIRVTKNKTAPPYMEGEYEMTHGEGINVEAEILDWGTKCDVLYKKGHSYYYDETFKNDTEKNKEHIFFGKSKKDSIQFLKDNVELSEILYNIILERYVSK